MKPRNVEGEVRFHQDARFVDMSEGNWLALATCGYMLDELQMDLKNLGLPYTVDNKLPIKENLIKAGTWSGGTGDPNFMNTKLKKKQLMGITLPPQHTSNIMYIDRLVNYSIAKYHNF